MLKKNNQDIIGIYKGTQKIKKIYKDNITLYEEGGGGILPSAYQQVEYIESTGTQYIDTGLYADNYTDYIIEMELTTANIANQQYFAGQSTRPPCPKLYMDGNNISRIVIQSSTKFNLTNIEPYTKIKIELKGSRIYLNDNLMGSLTRQPGTGTLPHWIFNAAGEPTLFANMKLYRLQITRFTETLRDFIPCYRKSDNEIGLYDIVNNVFYTNDGTGTFIKGNNI